MLIRIVPDCDLFRGDSEYGTAIAIWEMLHNSNKTGRNGIGSI